MKLKKIPPALMLGVLAGTLVVLIAGCGGEDKTSDGTASANMLLREVILSEYKIEPEHMSVKAGRTVRFIVKNEGTFTHEFRLLLNTPVSIDVPPKSKDRLDVVFAKSGDFEYVCDLSDHERQGMKGEISVEP